MSYLTGMNTSGSELMFEWLKCSSVWAKGEHRGSDKHAECKLDSLLFQAHFPMSG